MADTKSETGTAEWEKAQSGEGDNGETSGSKGMSELKGGHWVNHDKG